MESAQNVPDPPPPPTQPAAPPPPPRSGGAGRVVAMVLISIGGLVGLALALGGLAIVIAHGVARDDDGYYTTDTERLVSNGYAITSDGIDLGRDSIGFNTEDLGATLRFSIEGAGDKPAFVGIGRSSDVDAYLRGVPHTQIDDFGDRHIRSIEVPGRARPAGDPGSQDIWVAQSEGTGTLDADFDLSNGTWTAVAMNADASRGVIVDGEAGVKIDWLIWVGVGLGVVGLLIAGSCIYGVIRLARDRRAVSAPPPAAAP